MGPFSSRKICFILASLLVSSYCSNCEQLSTVFILEPSDYSAPESTSAALVSNGEDSSDQLNTDSSNTRIITDNGDSTGASPTTSSSLTTLSTFSSGNGSSNKSSKALLANQKVALHNSQHSSNNNHLHHHNSHHHQQQSEQQHSPHNSQQTSENKQHYGGQSNNQDREVSEVHSLPMRSSSEEELDDAPMSRRLEEESQYPASTRLKTPPTTARSSITQPTSAPTSRSKQLSSSSTGSYNDRDQSSTPKPTEERLLISITSDEDDYKPMKLGNGMSPEGGKPRQPSITISIQDSANLKQNGQLGGPGSAVILRPSENGQGIVISTLGGAQLATSQLNGNPNQKPNTGYTLINPSNGGLNNHHLISNNNNNNNNNNNRDPPYREPIDVPIQSASNPYTSTYRPSPINGANLNERPITSTLIDQPRPPIMGNGDQRPPSRPILNEERPVRLPVNNNQQGLDERPPRPGLIPEESNYDLQRPPPSPRPSSLSRPINQPDPNGFDPNEELNNPRPINNQQQQQPGPSEPKYPLSEKNCGLVHETRIVGGEEANPDDFLWMAAIIKSKPINGEARPFCGGSLITRRHILTAAHCLENLAPRDVLVRLGSYDFDDSTASSLSADYAIDQFRVPASYSKKTHASDIAIMRLKTPLSLNDNYKTVCMPQPRRSYVGALATVTGYGSQSQTFRRAAPKLRQVTVPVWENRKCAVVYKKNLTESFLCAGYEEGGKDACQGDSGGPLMTEGPGERMMVIGIVSHGIGCGSPGYPGVYTRTTTYLDWIEKNTRE